MPTYNHQQNSIFLWGKTKLRWGGGRRPKVVVSGTTDVVTALVIRSLR